MCDRKISTENGVLTCDLPTGHEGFHHATHAGWTTVVTDRHKSTSPTPFTDSEGNYLAVHEVEPLEIEWPVSKDGEPHRVGKETKAHQEREIAKAKLGPQG